MEAKSLPGKLKAAILISAIDDTSRRRLMDGLGREEREAIQQQISQLGDVGPELMEIVAREFAMAKGTLGPEAQIGEGGEGRAGSDRKPPEVNGEFKSLNKLEVERLCDLIKDEHPQTIAVILVHLSSEAAGKVMLNLPEDLRCEITSRIASLDKVISGMVAEIDEVFAEIMSTSDSSVSRNAGGVARVADIFNQMDGSVAQSILNEIEESNPELADEIKERMFVFEDLVLVDDRGLQKVLRRVETKELAIALKAGSDNVRQKVFKNMSERAREMLIEEIDDLGPVRMKDVEDAQQKITKIIQSMQEKGDIVVSGRSGSELV
jgi:flagellar motor switch protein FliG